MGQALFFAQVQGGNGQLELKLEDFVAQVKTGAQATRTHLWRTMANPGEMQVEVVMRLPVPAGAAVTRAVLHVGAEAVEGAFVARERAREITRSITERRRDSALITWNGPEWIDATVFPVGKHDRRVLELEWIQPTASRDGCLWYRVPVIAHEGGKARRPSRITVDGVATDLLGRAWPPLATEGKVGDPAVARGPGEPFGYAFAPAQERKPGPTRLVLAAETSRAMPPVSASGNARCSRSCSTPCPLTRGSRYWRWTGPWRRWPKTSAPPRHARPSIAWMQSPRRAQWIGKTP